MTPRSAAVTAASSSSGRSITGIANPRTVPYRNPDLRIRGREIHPFRWTNIDTLYPRPYTPLAAIVAVDSVRIAAGVVTAGEGGRTTGERDTCKDRAQKNPTANHGCLSFLPVRRARRGQTAATWRSPRTRLGRNADHGFVSLLLETARSGRGMPRAALAKAFVRLASTRTPATAPLGRFGKPGRHSSRLASAAANASPAITPAGPAAQPSPTVAPAAPPLGVLEVGIEGGEHAVMRGHGHGLGSRRDRREDKRR